MSDLSAFQLLASKSKKNQVSCAGCCTQIKEAHLICIKFYNKNGKIFWKSEYTVGCTHEDWDGESWCDSCVTIADNNILCSRCGNLDWGQPKFVDNKLKYLWTDGSISSLKTQ
tara:strand:+ start:267 stop:605 length:339 start_codon:yes stop_codon:yes gene_type:complete